MSDRNLHIPRFQHRQKAVKLFLLPAGCGKIPFVCLGKVAENALYLHIGKFCDFLAQDGIFFRHLHADPAHARIHGNMALGGLVQTHSRPGQGFRLLPGGKGGTNSFFHQKAIVFRVGMSQNQNRLLGTGISQLHSLCHRRHAEEITFCFQRFCHRHSAVTVGICLHHRHHRYTRLLFQHAVVAKDRVQIDFYIGIGKFHRIISRFFYNV